MVLLLISFVVADTATADFVAFCVSVVMGAAPAGASCAAFAAVLAALSADFKFRSSVGFRVQGLWFRIGCLY